MKNSTLKIFAIAFFTLALYCVNAQTWYVCYDTPTSNFRVDVDPTNGGLSPDGSAGSWYAWAVNNGATALAGNDADGPAPNTNNSNQATVTWNGVNNYVVTATEFNDCDTTTGDVTTINVAMVKADVTALTPNATFACGGDPITITITGTPGSTVNYTLSGGATGTPNSPVLIGAGGTAVVTIATGTLLPGAFTFTVTGATFSATQPNGAAFTCTTPSSDLTVTSTTVTFTVGDAPTISPIEML